MLQFLPFKKYRVMSKIVFISWVWRLSFDKNSFLFLKSPLNSCFVETKCTRSRIETFHLKISTSKYGAPFPHFARYFYTSICLRIVHLHPQKCLPLLLNRHVPSPTNTEGSRYIGWTSSHILRVMWCTLSLFNVLYFILLNFHITQ